MWSATLHIPAESLDGYKSTHPWSDFANIVALTNEDSVIINVSATDSVVITASAGVITLSGLEDGKILSYA